MSRLFVRALVFVVVLVIFVAVPIVILFCLFVFVFTVGLARIVVCGDIAELWRRVRFSFRLVGSQPLGCERLLVGTVFNLAEGSAAGAGNSSQATGIGRRAMQTIRPPALVVAGGVDQLHLGPDRFRAVLGNALEVARHQQLPLLHARGRVFRRT